MLAFALTAAGGYLAHRLRWPLWAGALLGINLATIFLYGFDKWAAKNDWLRVPEKVLHAVTLLGGTPGAAFAQRTFRHKTQKESFRKLYWAGVFLQVLCLAGATWWQLSQN